ncbi:GDYXXLXY domain-containing protein [Pinisolibacter sp.]|uniref:GDYXXLXY domain-containing protein n=1 Tax=Pinisolibacter sp. TaxID=2172024 RepID=UPI002FDD46F0
MRRTLFLLAGVAVAAVLGSAVWRAEALLASGDEVLLELAPVDPRSLMQGDYMRLAWAMERETIALPEETTTATIVLALDPKRVGRYRRLLSEGAPGADEHAFQVRRGRFGERFEIEPHSFLFQEGHAAAYAKAKYGIFRVDIAGRHLLAGLADGEGVRIDPK